MGFWQREVNYFRIKRSLTLRVLSLCMGRRSVLVNLYSKGLSLTEMSFASSAKCCFGGRARESALKDWAAKELEARYRTA